MFLGALALLHITIFWKYSSLDITIELQKITLVFNIILELLCIFSF